MSLGSQTSCPNQSMRQAGLAITIYTDNVHSVQLLQHKQNTHINVAVRHTMQSSQYAVIPAVRNSFGLMKSHVN